LPQSGFDLVADNGRINDHAHVEQRIIASSRVGSKLNRLRSACYCEPR
jgi:hypothetical protein